MKEKLYSHTQHIISLEYTFKDLMKVVSHPKYMELSAKERKEFLKCWLKQVKNLDALMKYEIQQPSSILIVNDLPEEWNKIFLFRMAVAVKAWFFATFLIKQTNLIEQSNQELYPRQINQIIAGIKNPYLRNYFFEKISEKSAELNDELGQSQE